MKIINYLAVAFSCASAIINVVDGDMVLAVGFMNLALLVSISRKLDERS